MHNSEFEKQVQQKMQELRFQPGSDVWTRVQADIQKKKRRRPFIIFLLLVGITAGSASLYYGLKNDNAQQVSTVTTKPETDNNNNNQKNNSNPQSLPQNTGSASSSTNDKNDDDKTNATSNNKIKTDDADANNNASNNKVHINTPNTIKTTKATRSGNIGDRVDKRIAANKPVNKNKTSGNRSTVSLKQPKNDNVSEDNNVTTNDTIKDSLAQNPVTTKQPTLPADSGAAKPADKSKVQQQQPVVKTVDSIAMKPFGANTKKPKQRSWEYGINAGVGVSDIGEKLINFSALSNSAYRDSLGASRQNGGFTPSFQIGGYVTRGKKKLRLKLGLNYEYFAQQIKVGNYVTGSRLVNTANGALGVVDRYYTAGSQTKFINSYHFVSVPVSFQWRLNKNEKFGVIWENGIELSHLVKTHALLYDGFTRTYYKDESVYTKNHVMASTAVLFNFETKNKTRLYAGPHVQYGLTNLMNYDARSNHLRYVGLKFMMNLNKK